jgi:hypothetical protein
MNGKEINDYTYKAVTAHNEREVPLDAVTDRLAWAALACGLKFSPSDHSILNEAGTHTIWNPLEDDGQAFRLKSKLFLDVSYILDEIHVERSHPHPKIERDFKVGEDALASEREAIVRTAARLGYMTMNAEGLSNLKIGNRVGVCRPDGRFIEDGEITMQLVDGGLNRVEITSDDGKRVYMASVSSMSPILKPPAKD